MQPSNPHPTAADDKAGRDAERKDFLRLLEGWLQSGAILAYAMPDALVVLPDRTAAMFEYKFQEIYTAPPFNGHGLPVSQAERYMRIRELSGMPTQLIVQDKPYGLLYTRWLHYLQTTDHFETAGKKKTPRRVYRATQFHQRTGKKRLTA